MLGLHSGLGQQGTVSKEHLGEEVQSPWRCPSTCFVTAAWPTVFCKKGKAVFCVSPFNREHEKHYHLMP